MIAYTRTAEAKTSTPIASGTADAAYTYSAPLSADEGEHVATIIDTTGTPFATAALGDVFTDLVSGLQGVVIALTSGTEIDVQFESAPPVNAGNVTYTVVRESYPYREIQFIKGNRQRTIRTTMTLAAILAALNAATNRFAIVNLTGYDSRKFASGPLFNAVVIDRGRIVRATRFTHGAFADSTVVGQARINDGIPTGVSELQYDQGGVTKTLLISTLYSKTTNPGSGVSTHDNLANVTGLLSGFNLYQSKVTMAIRQADLVTVRTPLAPLVAGTTRPVPDLVGEYANGGSEQSMAVDA